MSERNTPLEKRFDKLGPRVVEALERRHFEAYYCPTREEAVRQTLELIPKDSLVAWGGSETLAQLGILNSVKKSNPVIDRDTAASPEERVELMRKSLLCDVFLMSSNAITEDGQLYNIDGNGNRVACLIQGPSNVIIVAGMNKVVPDVESGAARVRNTASPANAVRLERNLPCAATGVCHDCLSPECFCCQIVVTRRSMHPGRIKVYLVGEDLGY